MLVLYVMHYFTFCNYYSDHNPVVKDEWGSEERLLPTATFNFLFVGENGKDFRNEFYFLLRGLLCFPTYFRETEIIIRLVMLFLTTQSTATFI